MAPRATQTILIGFILVLAAACQSREATLTLVSSATGHPVEGALIYANDELTTYRSDVRGRVILPAEWGESGVTFWAKNHQVLEADLRGLSGEVQLTFDESLVNPREAEMVFEIADTLRGTYGPYRENNDILTYALDIRVDPDEKFVGGVNTMEFRMLADGARIQMDLFENMDVDSIVFEGETLGYVREGKAVFIDFPRPLLEGEVHTIDFHYSGHPQAQGRFGGIVFSQDSLGNHWVFTACQNIGASLWWPNKDQQPDEPDSMTMVVTVPSGYTDVSNGRLMGVEENGDGTTTFRWKIHYPINNYSVAVNIAQYTHWADTLDGVSMDFYVLPYHLEDAKRQFAQAKPMLQCFNDKLGPYPFPKDGYKLVEVSYSGMEHQSAVAYGNGWENGYLGRDWTGVGISPRFDFIIVHESAHEWYGNSVTANDVSDAWIHEGWGTWVEAVYVECMWGYDDAITYINGYQNKVGNREPIVGPTGVNHWPTQDQYFKGALFLNTLRHVIDDDEVWWDLIREYTAHFAYQGLWTQDVINFFNTRLQRDLRPIFQQYLYYWNLPVLELRVDGDAMEFRWRTDVPDFDMPVKVRVGQEMHTIFPTTEWGSEPLDGVAPEDWQPATELFYIEVERG
jgi:aminopeptidase N